MRNPTRLPIIIPVPVGHPDSVTVLRRYFAEMDSRNHGRPATDRDVDAAIAANPDTDLVPPTGQFLLARDRSGVAGCIGVRCVDVETAEVTRMYVQPGARGSGVGTALLAAAEDAARGLGRVRMRLESPRDLAEAHALYVERGYVQVPGYGDAPYAGHWYVKNL